MICSTCRHCGLCPGESAHEKIDPVFIPELKPAGEEPALFLHAEYGVAVDIGTTTIQYEAVELATGRILFSHGHLNSQVKIAGQDVLSRVKEGLSQDGLSRLRDCFLNESYKALLNIHRTLCQESLSIRKGTPVLKKIIFTGNTVMLSVAGGFSLEGFKAFPFSIPSGFDFNIPAAELYKMQDREGFFSSEVNVYFPPVFSAFIGADTVCALLDTIDFDIKKNQILCDAGTNCEMALYNPDTKEIWCDSAASGPAFEGYGIECGSIAKPGAVAKVAYENNNFQLTVISNTEPASICGSGVISALSTFLDEKLMDKTGAIDGDRIYLSDKVYISSLDIRNFQLAKSAVYTGLEALLRHKSQDEGIMYLAGGFGAAMDVEEAFRTGLFPRELSQIKICGNSALKGAVKILLNGKLTEQCRKICSSMHLISLPEQENYQADFLLNLSFPEW